MLGLMAFDLKRFSYTAGSFLLTHLLLQLSPALVREHSLVEAMQGYRAPVAVVVVLAIAAGTRKQRNAPQAHRSH